MSDRAGVTPEGGAPVRRPQPFTGADAVPAGRDAPVESPSGPAGGAAPADDAAAPAEAAGRADVAAPTEVAAPAGAAEPEDSAAAAERRDLEYEVPFDTGQLQALPTGQLLKVHRPPVEFHEVEVEEETQRRVYSYVGAVLGVIGAAASLFVGWLLPLSIAGIVFGVLGLRREEHGRVAAFGTVLAQQ